MLHSAQEAAEEAGACVQRVVAALLCPDADAAETGAAATDGAHAPADGAAGDEAGRERACLRGAAAPRLAAARDVASAWALAAADVPAEGGADSGGGRPGLESLGAARLCAAPCVCTPLRSCVLMSVGGMEARRTLTSGPHACLGYLRSVVSVFFIFTFWLQLF
jgi:hypothetical protein